VLHEPGLRTILEDEMNISLGNHGPHIAMQVAQTALAMAGRMSCETHEAQDLLPQDKKDRVNLLYHTCRNDWFVQGDYDDMSSHLELGRLHEVIRTYGTQRRMQEIFEETEGLYWLQGMPKLLRTLPMSTHDICQALIDLQVTVMRTNDELFSIMIDETLWAHLFGAMCRRLPRGAMPYARHSTLCSARCGPNTRCIAREPCA
jgi:hypothetical protein